MYALLSLPLLAIFACFQYLAIDNESFLLLTFSSYAFLAFGVILLVFATSAMQTLGRKVFVNVVVLIHLAVILFAAFSLATIPRGGISHTYHVTPKDFTMVAKYTTHMGQYGYYGGNYPYETLYATENPIGYISIRPDWQFELHIICEKPVNLTGTLYAGYIITSNPGAFYETRSTSITFANSASAYADLSTLHFLGWGSEYSSNQRTRLQGCKIELWVNLWVYGGNYGSKLNFTATTHEEIDVQDFVVDSQLQNMMAILLCGIFSGALLYVPAKSVMPRREAKIDPIINSVTES
jgi:hypothetical protein